MAELKIILSAPDKVNWDKSTLENYLYQQAKKAIGDALKDSDCPFEFGK